MLKLLLSLYFTCYFCYIFYTRVPDYFDGETVMATIKIDGKTNKALANYIVASKQYEINADYPLRKFKDEEKVELIYNPSKPEMAAIYSLWGYWFTWGELIMSVVLLLGLYKLATSITQNPTEQAINDQMETTDEPKKKYD
jgi:hypothetical protein